ncbi:MAG: hypothetical protein IT366_08965 [Candidatus Hydrogenedentes bacterium]|nr:hypothetical protein [Candidatus Hydrogenedentota bacterium]
MNAALERIEPILCHAHALVQRSDWQRAHDALRACVDYAELYRAPAHAEFNTAQLLESIVRGAARSLNNIGGTGATLSGDALQIAAIARAVIRNAMLELDAELHIAGVELDTVPAWQLRIDGPGRFTDEIDLGYDLALSPETAERIWTSATRGGRIDRRPAELDLRLKGVRAVLEVPFCCDDFIAPLREAEHFARILSSGETVTEEARQLHDALAAILARFDGQDDPPNPCDLQALIRDAFPPPDPQQAVRFEIVLAAEVPPQALRRNRMLRFLNATQLLARAALEHGGNMRLEIDYSVAQRAITLFVTGEGQTNRDRAEVYLPALQRALDVHGGAMEADFASNGFTLLVTLPDAIASTLDNWLPGWDTFSPRSIQMLRLLKSGGPVPPEELILNGVLEDELERRLLPRLSVAPAATLIHDLKPLKPELAPSSAQRSEKVLSQVKRGKPKKEICAPPYAAEIIYMFTIDQRHASAIGVKEASAPQTAELAKALSSTPLNYLQALRLLPQVFPT